ncbi:coatomer [Thecamonas trahens ATCC 50062]|uniref:Coatomer n=1 Tax=Thecamonas trahens ATCC 50062 TaxID=461836 RepID=A0A0L0DVX9_THETB|nr:coatomer [Thecamonas trahens ATCC 50062]KNC56375.1 coatomer [Thecamonas trahens ATCC 50062]|eukprot:XP_013760890.1 coatomer [Thecamonas trahens ATCC 50062]
MGAGASLAVCVCVTRQSMEVDGWQQGRGGAHGILSFRWTAPDSRPSTMSSNPFGDSRKGDDAHLREILGGKDSKEKVTAVKNVIYAMTVGKDMSRLFMDVVNCIQTKDLELKKLVYLYVMNYAQSKPDLAISAINTFLKDTHNHNPLIRALAIRTMGSIRVDTMIEHLTEPLTAALRDEDAYVRKTAAVCVAKLYAMNRSIVADHGFLESLQGLLEDGNPMVVANAVAALSEIQATTTAPVFEIKAATLNQILTALSECTEWGQVFILDALARYSPVDPREAESIIERVVPRLNHRNSSVALSAIRVLVKYLDFVTSQSFIRATCKRMSQPLASLLNDQEKPPEIQYVALRNINLIIQRWPNLLTSISHVRMLFCNYDDPIYVKLEKLEILVKLASESNIELLLLEFKTYAQEVDVEFVRKAVRAIGRCAIKLERSAQACIDVLLTLIETKVNYVVQEAIIVIKDIFRKYPNRYESIIATLCENLDELDEPEAKASMIWIVGEYAERIDNADELLDSFLETYADEVVDVQMALLTAIVKLFLKRHTDAQDMVHDVLQLVTQTADDPDLRDRGFLYWRLLSSNPEAAKAIVLSNKPFVSDDLGEIEPSLLGKLLDNSFVVITSHSYDDDDDDDDDTSAPDGKKAKRKAPERKIDPTKLPNYANTAAPAPVAAAASGGANAGLSGGASGGNTKTAATAGTSGGASTGGSLIDLMSGSSVVGGSGSGAGAPPPSGGSLLDLLSGGAPSNGGGAGAPPPSGGSLLDLMSGGASSSGGASVGVGASSPKRYVQPSSVVLPASNGKGMEVATSIRRADGAIFMDLTITNKSLAPIGQFQAVFNKSSFGLVPGSAIGISSVAPGATATFALPLGTNGEMALSNPLMSLQVALKNNVEVFYFLCMVPLGAVLVEDGKLERPAFIQGWKALSGEQESKTTVSVKAGVSLESAMATLEANNIFVIAKHANEAMSQMLVFTSAKTTNGIVIMSEFNFTLAGEAVVKLDLTTHVAQTPVLPVFEEYVKAVFGA